MAHKFNQRVTHIISSSAHALLDKIEGLTPIASLEQNIRDLDGLTEEVRTELGKVAANLHLSQRQHSTLSQEHAQIEQALDTALQQGKEELAKVAIARQLDIEAQLPILENNIEDAGIQQKELSGYIDALLSKRREMQDTIAHIEQTIRSQSSSMTSAASINDPNGALQSKLQGIQTTFDDAVRKQTGVSTSGHQASLSQTKDLNSLKDLVREQAIAERLAKAKTKG